MFCVSTEDAKEPSAEEAAARDLLASRIDGTLVHVDPPDFIICRQGRLSGGIEVTYSTHQGFRTLSGQLDKNGYFLPSPSLASSWLALLSWDDANLRRFSNAQVVDLVRRLEAAGVATDRDLEDEAVRDFMAVLGITHLRRLNRDGTPTHRIFLQPEPMASWVDPSAVDAAVANAAVRKRHVLSALEGERHLFLWVDPSSIAAAAAIDGEPSPEPPSLPEWVGEAWVAPAFGVINRLWHRTTQTPWTVLVE